MPDDVLGVKLYLILGIGKKVLKHVMTGTSVQEWSLLISLVVLGLIFKISSVYELQLVVGELPLDLGSRGVDLGNSELRIDRGHGHDFVNFTGVRIRYVLYSHDYHQSVEGRRLQARQLELQAWVVEKIRGWREYLRRPCQRIWISEIEIKRFEGLYSK